MKKMKMISVFLFLTFGFSGMLLAQTSSEMSVKQVGTYGQLLAAVRETRAEARVRVEKAVEQEKVREAWEIGKLIDAHVLQHKERADYGAKVLERLATDLGISRTELSYMLQFARTYPLFQPAEKLSWSHYEELLSLNDVKEQREVAAIAEKEKWTRDQIREEVKKRKAAAKGTDSAAAGGVPVPLEENTLTAKPGKPGTYKIVKATVGPETGKVVVDLGFSNYYKTSKDLRFKAGAMIEATPPFSGGGSAPSDMIRLSKRTTEDLYTYRAWVVRVLDGDTLEAVVDLGFGVRSTQTLRLRGLDAPELVSKEGKEAKEFVEKSLQIPGNGERGTQTKAKGPAIARSDAGATRQSQPFALIKTTKSDKYDRYLVDIFYIDAEGKEVYLNNLLLEKGYAVRVSE